MAQEVAAPIVLAEEHAPRAGRLRKGLHLLRQHPLGAFGLLCVMMLFGAGIFADVVAPYNPLASERGTSIAGSLLKSVSATDTRMVILNPKTGPGSTISIGEEQVRLDFQIYSEAGNQLDIETIRGINGTIAVDHEAGVSFFIPNDVNKLASPTLKHPFGTDRLGRDVLSRTIFGARISLMIGLVSIAVGITFGSFFGIVSGYLGGLVDSIIQRGVDMLLAFPALVLLLAIITVIGDESSAVRQFLADYTPVPQGTFWGIPNFLNIFIVSLAIGLAVAVGTARIIRGAVLSLKENVYIEAARSIGASPARIMWSHIMPNVAALIVILASIFLPIAILAEAAISFLGVGVPDPTPSWGADLSEQNRESALKGYWWPAFFPGFALSLVVLGFNMLGDAFRDISDPRLRGGSGPGGGAL